MEFLNHPILPVLSINEVDTAKHIVESLQHGGIGCVEITLRTENALLVLKEVAVAFPDVLVGAGTLRRPGDFIKVIDAGAQFAVSPGSTPELLAEASRWDLPYLPAAATVSELLALQDAGYLAAKVFPAESLGGSGFIGSISAPLGEMQFVPSGGVNGSNFKNYLKLPSVPAVSGSWMLETDLIQAGDWPALAELVRDTVKLLDVAESG